MWQSFALLGTPCSWESLQCSGQGRQWAGHQAVAPFPFPCEFCHLGPEEPLSAPALLGTSQQVHNCVIGAPFQSRRWCWASLPWGGSPGVLEAEKVT